MRKAIFRQFLPPIQPPPTSGFFKGAPDPLTEEVSLAAVESDDYATDDEYEVDDGQMDLDAQVIPLRRRIPDAEGLEEPSTLGDDGDDSEAEGDWNVASCNNAYAMVMHT